jgi:hypothetical protein
LREEQKRIVALNASDIEMTLKATVAKSVKVMAPIADMNRSGEKSTSFRDAISRSRGYYPRGLRLI